MNDNITARIKCPFYVAHNRGAGNSITITCENIKTNMGFNVKNRLSFVNEKQRLNLKQIAEEPFVYKKVASEEQGHLKLLLT